MISPNEFLKSVKKFGSVRGAARALNIPKSTAQDLYKRITSNALRESKIKNPVRVTRPPRGEVKRFILSSAQDQSVVHKPFLENLEAYAEHIGADILISGFTYNKSLFEDHEKNKTWYADEITQYLTQDRFELGKNVVFCGEMNILPTATNPLSGLETYTRDRWGIFPHAKVQQQSIATMKDANAKMILTTGTVTKPNYVLKKAGIKAHFHHVYGAVIVEICADGAFFVRHLLGDKKDGSFYDLTYAVKDGKVTEDNPVLAITWGDIHIEKMDKECFAKSFGYPSPDGETSLLDYLRPEYQFIHDIIDFKSRNHHNLKDPHFLYEMYINKTEKIEDAIDLAADFLDSIERPFSSVHVVESNHDLALLKWLKNSDYRLDQVNAKLFLEAQLAVYSSIEKGDSDFSILQHLIEKRTKKSFANFLREDDSFIIAKEHGGIECAMHGHLGANGARGHSRAFAKMGPKANTGHTHSAAIFDGIYTAGVSGSLDMGYNKGLSSWSHTHIITYGNGKRTLITMNKGRFHA